MIVNSGGGSDSATTVLPERIGSTVAAGFSRSVDQHPNWKPARRDPRPLRFVIAMVVVSVFVAVAVTGVVNYLQQVAHQQAEPPASEAAIPPDGSIPPGV